MSSPGLIDTLRVLLIPLFVCVLYAAERVWPNRTNDEGSMVRFGPLINPLFGTLLALLTAAAVWLGWSRRPGGSWWVDATGVIVAPMLAWWFVLNENHAAVMAARCEWRRRDSYKRPISILLVIVIVLFAAVPVAAHRFLRLAQHIP